jgi:hypothetical protein
MTRGQCRLGSAVNLQKLNLRETFFQPRFTILHAIGSMAGKF